MPDCTNLAAGVRISGHPCREALSAALFGIDYFTVSQVAIPRPCDKVHRNTISVLTEASRLTKQPIRQTSSGQREADPVPRAALRIECAAFLTEALAGAAANAGCIDTILTRGPGSWGSSVVGDALRAAVGHDDSDLWRHGIEPVNNVLNPHHILFDGDASDWVAETDAAEREIQRREAAIRPGIIYPYGRRSG